MSYNYSQRNQFLETEISNYQNGLYQGLYNDNLREGFGIFIWDSGKIYIGIILSKFYDFL